MNKIEREKLAIEKRRVELEISRFDWEVQQGSRWVRKHLGVILGGLLGTIAVTIFGFAEFLIEVTMTDSGTPSSTDAVLCKLKCEA